VREDIHIYVHQDSFCVLTQILSRLTALERKVTTMAAPLDQVLQDVTDESTQIDSLSTLIAGLQQQVKDALSGATLPPAIQAKVDAVFNQAENNKAKIAAALNANVPPAP
jgi:uncharacterized protein YoxC